MMCLEDYDIREVNGVKILAQPAFNPIEEYREMLHFSQTILGSYGVRMGFISHMEKLEISRKAVIITQQTILKFMELR